MEFVDTKYGYLHLHDIDESVLSTLCEHKHLLFSISEAAFFSMFFFFLFYTIWSELALY